MIIPFFKLRKYLKLLNMGFHIQISTTINIMILFQIVEIMMILILYNQIYLDKIEEYTENQRSKPFFFHF